MPARGSPKTVAASLKEMPCFARLYAAFLVSHSNCMIHHNNSRVGNVEKRLASRVVQSDELLFGPNLNRDAGRSYETAPLPFGSALAGPKGY